MFWIFCVLSFIVLPICLVALWAAKWKIDNLKEMIHGSEQSYSKLKGEIEITPNPVANPNPVMNIDANGTICFANHGAEPILTSWGTDLNNQVPQEWVEVIEQVLLSGAIQTLEIECSENTYLATLVPIQKQKVYLYAMDITDLKTYSLELGDDNTSQTQTKLPNQLAFRQCLDKNTQKTDEKMAVLIVRFDDYSQFVYSYGQAVANIVLDIMAQRLKEKITPAQTLARISENEFGLIYENASIEQAASEYIHPVISSCNVPYQVDDVDLHASVSVGITFYPDDSSSPAALARNAQLALSRASNTDEHYAFFQRDMEEELIVKGEMRRDLHTAIKEGQFKLVYQPQIDLSSATMVGCEALLRWKHPTKGYISPDSFISIAEELGLMLHIGEWVISEVCRQMAEWRQQGYNVVQTYINLSPKQILESDIVNIANKYIEKYNLSPEMIGFEFTETALMNEKDRVIQIFKRLEDLGFDLALDDFGTSYASLNYIAQFPLTKIKIDRSFISNIKHEEESHAVTKGIISMAAELGKSCVAEGVETQAQMKYLQKNGCDVIQGFIFGKPESAETFIDYLKADWKAVIDKKQSGEPIKVGILHSFSGTMAISEQAVANATLMAIDEINRAGGVLGRSIQPVKADGCSNPEKFAKEAERLITKENVSAIFGIWNSHSRKHVKSIVERHKHLLVYPMAYEGLEQSPNILYTGGLPNQIIMPAIKWAFDNLGKRFFLVGSDYIGPRGNIAISIDQIKAQKGEVVGEEYVPLGRLDFAQIVDKIKETQPDVILNHNNGEANIAFIKALREAGITSDKLPIISFNMAEVELNNFSTEEVAGDYLAWNYFNSVSNQLNDQFIKKFKAAFGEDQTSSDPIESAYTGVYLWAQAVQEAGTTDLEMVRNTIKGQRYQGPGGPTQVDKSNMHTWKVSRMAQINDRGQVRIVWSSDQPIAPMPFPDYRSQDEWENYLHTQYLKWGHQWENKERKANE